MTPSRSLPAALVAALVAAAPLLALVLLAPASRAQAPASSPSASAAPASASAASSLSASAAASASASAPAPPRLRADPPAEGKTKPPTVAEWKQSTRISFDRPLPSPCEARRMREWVRMTCQEPAASVTLIAGPSEGFYAAISPLSFGESQNDWSPTLGSFNLQFPVRRGERRLYEISTVVGGGYGGPSPSLSYLVESSWFSGEEPVLLVHRL